MTTAPRVFVSYAWEDMEYRAWVERLAAQLRQDGVASRLDVWDRREGQSLAGFLSQEVEQAQRVLVLASPEYVRRVRAMEQGEAVSGVGWEWDVLTTELFQRGGLAKLVVARTRGELTELPAWFAREPVIDLTGWRTPARLRPHYEELLARLTGQRTPGPPVAATVRQVARGVPVPLFQREAGPGEDESRPATRATVPPRTATAADPVSEAELAEYRSWALQQFGELAMVGVGAGDFRFPMEEVFVPLGLQERHRELWGPEGRWHHHLLVERTDGAAPGAPARDPAPAPTAEAWPGYGDGGRDVQLEEVFGRAAGNGVLFLGHPGAGKTTVLRKLLHQCFTQGGPALGLPAGIVPVLLRLRSLPAELLEQRFPEALRLALQPLEARLTRPDLAGRLWRRGRLLLLCDGLDEVAEPERRARICQYLAEEVHGQAGIWWAVASRYSGYDGEKIRFFCPVLHLDVRPLDDEQIAALARGWFVAARRQLERTAAVPDLPAAERRAAEDLTRLQAGLQAAGQGSQRMKSLVASPLLLTLLCVVILRGRPMPQRRVEFYGECLRVLLGFWSRGKGLEPLLEPEDALAILRAVALRLHRRGRQDDLQLAELEQVATAFFQQIRARLPRPPTAAALLDWLCRGAGVLTEFTPGRFGFLHLGLQEYLTADELANQGEPTLGELARQLGAPWWREVILLLLAIDRPNRFEPFMDHVVRNGQPEQHLELLRQCLNEAHHSHAGPFLPLLRPTFGERWAGRLGRNPVLIRRRAAVLRLFAGREDPRLQELARHWIADPDEDLRALARQTCGLVEVREVAVVAGGAPVAAAPADGNVWVEPRTGLRFRWVPGGEFQMGADDLVAPDWADENLRKFWEQAPRPVHPVRISPFWLAETPVTNAQYGLMLRAGGVAEPKFWRDPRFSDPEQPVVGVSWLEAMAYCRWLSELTGQEYTLPSEARWEFAARGSQGWDYPWGNEPPDKNRACYGQDYQQGRPDPVGSHPAGRGPFGHLDLAGTVWEWCLDEWSDDYRGDLPADSGILVDPLRGRPPDPRPLSVDKSVDQKVDQGDNLAALRVVRGGSWNYVAEVLRCARRSRLGPEDRLEGLGLRVVCRRSREHG